MIREGNPVEKILVDNADAIAEAICKDFGHRSFEAMVRHELAPSRMLRDSFIAAGFPSSTVPPRFGPDLNQNF